MIIGWACSQASLANNFNIHFIIKPMDVWRMYFVFDIINKKTQLYKNSF